MDLHQTSLITAARRYGVQAEDLSDTLGHDVVRYHFDGQSQVVRAGKIFESLSSLSEFLCQEKHVCKAVLAEIGIPSPAGIQFDDADASRDAIKDLLGRAAPLVLKPSASEGGEGVFADLRSFDAVRQRWHTQRNIHPHFILEEQVAGIDLRIHVIAGQVVAACVREAAYVKGDGTRAVTTLVTARQAVIRTQNPQNRLELDDASDRLLATQGLTRDSVPASGQRVVLASINNLALGGVATDCTDDIHARYATWARDMATRFNLAVFAIDVLTEDPTRDPNDAARVIEINAKPDWLHHTFSERRQHDIARLLLEHLFSTTFT